MGIHVGYEVRGGSTPPETEVSYRPIDRRWDLAFLGILSYLIIEYTRLPAMFPVLQVFDISKVAAGVSALGLLISVRLKNRGNSTRAIDVCLMLFWLASVFSALFAGYSDAAWKQIIDSTKCVVVYFLVSRIVVSAWRSRLFVLMLLLLNLKLAQFAIRLYLRYGEMDVGGRSVAMVGLSGNAFFGNSNDFGVGMCVVLPIAASLLAGESKIIPRLIYLASFLGIFAAMLLSGCRGAFLATCVAAAVFVIRGKRKALGIVMGFLIVAGMLFMLPSGNLERLRTAFSPGHDTTVSQRLGFWKAGFKMLKSHPVLGVGPGNFAPTFRDKYALAERDPGAWAPHSIYIQGFAEVGLLGCLPLFIMFWLAFRINGKTCQILEKAGADPKNFELRLAHGLEMGIVAYLVSGAFLTVLYYPHLWFLLGISAGLRASVQESINGGIAEKETVLDSELAFSAGESFERV